jgi:hypothetical protein
MGGSGGESTALEQIADSLHGFRYEAPCIDADHFGADKQDNCDMAPEVDRQTHQVTLGGDADVTLHVRGIVEPNNYMNGTLVPPRFYIGGVAGHTGYTAYSLEVAEPPGLFFFNYNDTTGHFTFTVDYEVTIEMQGQTQVTLEVNGQTSIPDGHGVSNRDEVIVPGVDPAPAPYNGQFLQLDVLLVEALAD